MYNVACELSQCMGKTEYSSTVKNRTNSIGKKYASHFAFKVIGDCLLYDQSSNGVS